MGSAKAKEAVEESLKYPPEVNEVSNVDSSKYDFIPSKSGRKQQVPPIINMKIWVRFELSISTMWGTQFISSNPENFFIFRSSMPPTSRRATIGLQEIFRCQLCGGRQICCLWGASHVRLAKVSSYVWKCRHWLLYCLVTEMNTDPEIEIFLTQFLDHVHVCIESGSGIERTFSEFVIG